MTHVGVVEEKDTKNQFLIDKSQVLQQDANQHSARFPKINNVIDEFDDENTQFDSPEQPPLLNLIPTEDLQSDMVQKPDLFMSKNTSMVAQEFPHRFSPYNDEN